MSDRNIPADEQLASALKRVADLHAGRPRPIYEDHFHLFALAREIEQLRLDLAQQTANAKTVLDLQNEVQRLNLKCGALAFLLYGSSVCTRSHPHENMNEECARLTQVAREANRRAADVGAPLIYGYCPCGNSEPHQRTPKCDV